MAYSARPIIQEEFEMRIVLCLAAALIAAPTAAVADPFSDFDKRFEESRRKMEKRFDEADKRFEKAQAEMDREFDKPMPFESWFKRLENDPESAFGWMLGIMAAFVIIPIAMLIGHAFVFTLLTFLAFYFSIKKKWKRAFLCLVYPILTLVPFALMLEPFSICLLVGYGYWFYKALTNHQNAKPLAAATP